MSPVASLSRPSSENGAVASRAARVSKPAHAPSSPSSASTPGSFFDDDSVSEVSAAASDAAAAAVSETLGPTCRAASSAACTYRLARSLGRDDGGGDAVVPPRALGISATGDGATASIAPGGASSRRRSSSRAACCSPGVSGGWIESLARGWIESLAAPCETPVSVASPVGSEAPSSPSFEDSFGLFISSASLCASKYSVSASSAAATTPLRSCSQLSAVSVAAAAAAPGVPSRGSYAVMWTYMPRAVLSRVGTRPATPRRRAARKFTGDANSPASAAAIVAAAGG
mmetsp:Transcript_3886/g.17160  ORF Transcript_3886/g.17160 Transcript_3886/m.17160 type:complete len:286 (+) Transcript_3886:144-1001(+)